MTDLSRRTLLGASAMGAAAAPFAAAEVAAAAPNPALYIKSRFIPLRNKTFKLNNRTRTWAVKLTEITDLPDARRGDNHHFTLTFRTSLAGPPQGTYTLRRANFAATTLFLVPDASHRTYVAVINRRA